MAIRKIALGQKSAAALSLTTESRKAAEVKKSNGGTRLRTLAAIMAVLSLGKRTA
jgi:uncharacterized protein HemX